jgi:hypothetical protein
MMAIEDKKDILALSMEPLITKLNKMKCKEGVDIKKLRLLITSSLLQIDKFNQFENEKQQLEKYYKLFKENIAEILYQRVFAYGRVYAKNGVGLQLIRKEIRHTISEDYYIDLDIVNAHATILYQLMVYNNIPCEYLEKYINNRDKILYTIMEKYNTKRESAKNLFIMMLYGGTFVSWAEENNIYKKEIDFIKKFKSELKTISKIILANNSQLKNLIIKKKETKNIESSVCSYVLQEYENRILEVIYDYCVDEGYIEDNNCVLTFDGLMIEKNKYKPELLEELNIVVRERTGFDLQFIQKPMDKGYSMEEIMNSIEITEYEKIKYEFEKNNFKINNPLMFGTVDENEILILRSRTEFINVYENLRFMLNKKGELINTSFVLEWLKDSSMRTYDKIDFLPMYPNISPKIYNSFKGYKASKKKLIKTNIEESCMYKHIKEVICNNDENLFNYLIKWLANLLQHPYKRANTAFILKGIQGTGKDTVFNWFGNNIIGNEYYLNESSLELVFGRFNSSINNKILIVLNETSGKDTYERNEKIKMSITREKNIIEYKGMTPYETNNNIAYVFLTNNENPIKVPIDDRRYFCSETSNEYANNNDYFKKLYEEINLGDYDRAFYEYFMSIDIKDYNFTINRPITKFYEDLREINIPIMVRFFENLIENSNEDNICIQSSILYNKFNEFITINRFKIDVSSTKFGMDIINYKGVTKRRNKHYTTINININELKTYLSNKYLIEFNESLFINDNNLDE